MMFEYDFDRLDAFLRSVVTNNIESAACQWLDQAVNAVRTNGDRSSFNMAFVAMPRKTGKDIVHLSEPEEKELSALRGDVGINGWTADRLARVWLLMQLNPSDKEKYIATIENLFLAAEMSELVALYSSLPMLAYPESWRKRCAEGIRNNIGLVLESVICHNPYPAEQLDDGAFNQLVLKAIFTDYSLLKISGLQRRLNADLAEALTDYAHERWAAHRSVNPLLWLCVSPFIGAGNFSDIEHLFSSEDARERQAAALVCYHNAYEPARQLLEKNQSLKKEVESGKITWKTIAALL